MFEIPQTYSADTLTRTALFPISHYRAGHAVFYLQRQSCPSSSLLDGTRIAGCEANRGRPIGIQWIGKRGHQGQHIQPKEEHGYKVVDDQIWDEARAYAYQLAIQAGLSVEGEMPAQCPVALPSRLTDIKQWIAHRVPTVWMLDNSIDGLSRE